MWYNTVGHGHIPALRCAIESFGADRLLLGSDCPYETGELFVHAVDYISASGIRPEQANAIMNTTATALLKIQPGAQERPTAEGRMNDCNHARCRRLRMPSKIETLLPK